MKGQLDPWTQNVMGSRKPTHLKNHLPSEFPLLNRNKNFVFTLVCLLYKNLHKYSPRNMGITSLLQIRHGLTSTHASLGVISFEDKGPNRRLLTLSFDPVSTVSLSLFWGHSSLNSKQNCLSGSKLLLTIFPISISSLFRAYSLRQMWDPGVTHRSSLIIITFL